MDANGDVTLGNAAADAVTVNGTTTFANPVTANGAVTLGNGNDNITLNAGSGVISASGDKIENVADPTAAQDAATKNYIDNTVLGGVVGPFVQLGPAALQTYTGANPLIRLNETGGGTPNLMDLRTAGTQHLLLTNGGSLTVTAIEGSPIGGTTRSTGAFTTLDANGAVTLGNGNDNITLNAGSGIISASGDKIENVADPTAAQDAATKNYVDNGFVRLGPASAQTYTGANPLIRLDETGGSAPNLMDLRTAGTQHLVLTNAGALTATSIQATPIGTTTRSLANVTDLDANGDVTLGNAAADAVTVNGTTTFANPVTANGAVTLGNGNDNITLNAGSGVISASGDKIENVADPTAAQDAATKNYVDNQVTSAAWALGGNSAPSSNIFGTISATDIDIRTSNATRMTVGSGGGIGINATPVATTKLAIGTVDPAGGIGLGVNMTGTTTSTGIKVTNVGASGTNDAGIAVSSSAAGTGTGIRIGGGAG
ncbi:MAG: hypothetical protein IPM61_00370 [Chlorobi bacterium]|nr:hypothetical protein [Chlorobiota bacterium]